VVLGCHYFLLNSDDVYDAVIMAQPLWEFARLIWWM